MPQIDTAPRDKWPAPHPYPRPAELEAEVERARAESRAEPLRAKARAVLALLRAEYGEPSWPILQPLDQLIEVLLSHRTTEAQTWAAFTALRERFPSWEAVRDAPVEEIAEAIHGVQWPTQKAPRIKSILQKITEQRGSLDELTFLYEMPIDEANAWLQGLGGVGPKSAACVLLFACHRPVLPIDTHLHRVGGRLGLIGPDVTADEAHVAMQALLPDPSNAADVLAFHRDMLLHGQRICVWRNPRCPKCVLRDWCDYYATLTDKG